MTTTATPVQVRPRTFAEAEEVLAETLPGYESRPPQTLLATSIEEAWADDVILIGQAGTGTGKSLASTIPAILSGKRVLYSTGTKALQAQLMEKDLPFLQAHLGVKFEYSMLQGIANYFCPMKAAETISVDGDARALWDEFNGADPEQIPEIRSHFQTAVSDQTWRSVTTTSDDCARKQCPHYDECPFMAARARSAAADILVVNHAIVAIDAKIRSTAGESLYLGDYDHIIIDEAHEFEEFVTSALTVGFGEGTFVDLGNRISAIANTVSGDESHEDLAEWLHSAGRTVNSKGAEMVRAFSSDEGRLRQVEIVANAEPVVELIEALSIARTLMSQLPPVDAKDREAIMRSQVVSRINNMHVGLSDFLLRPDAEIVRRVEIVNKRRYPARIEVIPVEVGPWLSENMWSYVRPVLVSATILTGGKIDFIDARLGLTMSDNEVRHLDVGTPFDYEKNSLLYVPEHIPLPSDKTRDAWGHESRLLMIELVKASQGRSLLLFTSRREMEAAYSFIAPKLPWDCKMQGQMPNDWLSVWFRENTSSVLFATRTFFTGIDVQGESLSTVIIDKLPFPVPNEPIFKARSEVIEAAGGSSFGKLSIPMMTLVLQQAFGRLIRTKTDRGVVAILDPRLIKKSYGTTIRRSLPAPHTTDLNDVDRFWSV